MKVVLSTNERSGLIDVLKGLACLVIVWHHLSSYGPMVDVARPLAPDLMEFLFNYGRFAVQVFLVVAGYMAAASLAPSGSAKFDNGFKLIGRRYARLALPYFFALTAAVWAASMARHFQNSEAIPEATTPVDVIAHMFMLQDLLGIKALLAGAWYLAIDLQLFAVTVLILSIARRISHRSSQDSVRNLSLSFITVGCALSLLWFNRHPELDITAFYFFGSYGLGLLTYWAVNIDSKQVRWRLVFVMSILGVTALVIEFRDRIAVAMFVGAVLLLAHRSRVAQAFVNSRELGPLRYLGRISYSVFLIHYPVLLLFNALMGTWFPESRWANVLALFVAFGCAVAVADQMYRHIEKLPLSRMRFVMLAAPLFMITAMAR